ncbi:MAG: chorismate synthase [Clostridiaceae bacterium]|jgi:chorismate synthase|nr:chorismate synthase [Clostridiaceae bacterium]
MSSIWGERLRISLFGESHGPAVGVVVDGFPAGMTVDLERINTEMERRRPKATVYSTKRKEADEVEILSGLYRGRTTGAPICGLVRNTDTRSRDYEETSHLARPGHADYTASVRFGGYNDFRGGGHFSARLTAPLVFAGALTRQFLEVKGIHIGSHIWSIGDITDVAFDMADITRKQLENLRSMELPVNDASCAELYSQLIDEARRDLDSVGGIIETAVIGLPAGIGTPYFCNVEGKLSSILFSIPAVKGVEFGAGFTITRMRGSKANDSFYMDGEQVRTKTNNNGGINGGITNGMPVVFRVALKPVPSIAKAQDTIDMKKMEDAVLEIEGRHDTCIVPRAVPVVEAACAIALCDLYLTQFGYQCL